jgi:RNA-dependent RNA polymerase
VGTSHGLRDAFLSCYLPDAPHNEGEKVPTEKILTDGCGFINGAALTLIARRLNLPSRPTAVQGRVAGSKGLWILHPEDRSHTEPPRIWIRDSQQKVKLPPMEEGSAHVIFDVITQSNYVKVPARLNYQTIINLAENGVDSEVFQCLMHEGLMLTFSSFTQWDGPRAMPLLWHAVNNLGGVTRTRLQKIAHGLERAIGLSNRFEMDRRDAEDDPDSDDEDPLIDSGERPLYSAVLELIQAGFDPRSSPILFEKMRYVVKQAMNRHLDKFHLEVRQSAEAFIVPGAPGVTLCIFKSQLTYRPINCPDPFNVLEEGEIHFKSSQELGDPLTESNVYCVRGPVLVSLLGCSL